MKSWLKSDQSTSSRFYSIHFNSSSHWSTFSLYHKQFILDLEKINIDQLSKNLKMHLNQVSARCSIMSLGIVLEFKRETGKNSSVEDHFVCTLRSVIQHRRCSSIRSTFILHEMRLLFSWRDDCFRKNQQPGGLVTKYHSADTDRQVRWLVWVATNKWRFLEVKLL